ncbi:MAG: aminotransferase class I/II-fold pyridoxal phosphate-dependent enzyme [Pseudomonadota bacterium]
MSQSSSPITRTEMPTSPFARLETLLDGLEPGDSVIDLTIGEPRHPMPDFLIPALAEAEADFGKYPAIRGTKAFRAAVADWLGRRYPALTGLDKESLGIIPLAGTREGLFYVTFSVCARRPDIENPAILVPNPFYHTYAAAGASGAELVLLSADRHAGFLPDLDAIDEELLKRTVAMFVCTPTNPQGTVASAAYIQRAIELARTHDFILVADECYSEIYTTAPPPGALETAWQQTGSLANVISMQSLSKRSNLPGLRAGYCTGDPEFIEKFASFRNVVGPQLPVPIQHACVKILGDEAHVEANRALYREKFDAADRILGNRYGYRRPDGGFFLWLDISDFGDSESVVKTLWKGCGVKLLPGTFLARTGADGKNPGDGYIRVAMVQDLAMTEDALSRMVDTLK